MPPIAAIRDDFTNNTVDPLWATHTTGSATVAETIGEARITLPSSTAGSHYGDYASTARYDLTGDACSININTMVATGVAATAFFQLILDGSNYYEWTQTSNTLKARKIVAGVTTDLYSVTWSLSTYQYLRIRESGGTVYFDSSTSASGGGTWTNRGSTTIASAFTVTGLQAAFGASCGNVASPGSFRLSDFNPILPLTAGTWRYTTADWQISNRLRPVTLAATANAQGAIVTADTMDASGVLSGNLRYFAGPLGSASGGYLALTEYASLALAQGSPFPIPLDGRVDLPALVDARFMRLYHRSTDGASHTIREYVPRRIVQADDIEAESITAINIAAHVITADQIGTVNLDATARITAAAGTIVLDNNGISIRVTDVYDDIRSYTFNDGAGHIIGGVSHYITTTDTNIRLRSDAAVVSGRNAGIEITAQAPTGKQAVVVISSVVNGVSGGFITTTFTAITLGGTSVTVPDGGINVGTATGATSGQIKSVINDSGTNTQPVVLTIGHNSTGTPAASFGADLLFTLESTTTADRFAGLIETAWVVATDASRTARMRIYAYDTAAREALRLEASGTAAMLGFFGAAAVAKPTVTGSRGGNAALASLLTGLANLGLVTDSSTA